MNTDVTKEESCAEASVEVKQSSSSKPICRDCGCEMYVSGHCATCPNCGYSLCSM